MKQTIYTGEFVGRDAVKQQGVVWRVDIWREYDNMPQKDITPGELTFDGDTPVEIAWDETEKHDAIVGSTCTIQIISPSDRAYIDLYAIRAGEIGVTVWRNGDLYWVGTLDPEFYEEPYESLMGYTVQLTFSDFGILDRLKYNKAGMRSAEEIIIESLQRCGLAPEVAVDTSLITLLRKTKQLIMAPDQSTNGRPIVVPKPVIECMVPSEIFVRSDNFYDEDGEASSLKEVIEGILQPLALRIEQRCGRVYIYDLNGLYHNAPSEMVKWDGSSQTLGVDTVANNATISWSPYAEVDELLPDECWPEDIETDAKETNIDNVSPKKVNGCDLFTYHLTWDQGIFSKKRKMSDAEVESATDLTDAGFSLWLTKQGRNVTLYPTDINNGHGITQAPQIYRIVPQHDGQESEGVALCWPSVELYESYIDKGHSSAFGNKVVFRRVLGDWRRHGLADFTYNGVNYNAASTILAERDRTQSDVILPPQPIFSTVSVDLPPMADDAVDLKIKMRMLMDVRFNPFESSVNIDGNNKAIRHKEDEANFNAHCNFVYVPIRAVYTVKGGANDGRQFVWSDMRIFEQQTGDGNTEFVTLADTMTGEWRRIDQPDADDPQSCRLLSYLAYYDTEDRREKSGVLGWKENRQCIHNTPFRLQTAITKSEAGQYIPYPPKAIQGPLGGSLQLFVMDSRWVISNDTNVIKESVYDPPTQAWKKINWILCELPQLEMVGTQSEDRELVDEDVEYKGEINPDAKEEISIDTICGTKKGGYPTARGAYFDRNGDQITALTRAGRTGQVEDLLIGTLYSQHATRHTKISGEAALSAGGLSNWAERLQGDTKFMILGETQDLQTGTSDLTIVELSPDEYKRKE